MWNTNTSLFTDTFLDIVKPCIQHYIVTVRPNDKPWYNSELRKLSRQRDRHKSTAIDTGEVGGSGIYKKTGK